MEAGSWESVYDKYSRLRFNYYSALESNKRLIIDLICPIGKVMKIMNFRLFYRGPPPFDIPLPVHCPFTAGCCKGSASSCCRYTDWICNVQARQDFCCCCKLNCISKGEIMEIITTKILHLLLMIIIIIIIIIIIEIFTLLLNKQINKKNLHHQKGD